MIVVNDNSTDSTPEILAGIVDSRVNVIHLDMQVGRSSARNIGLAVSSGRYVAILDSDDTMYPNRLEIEGKFLEKHRDYVLVGGVLDGHSISRADLSFRESDDVRPLLVRENIFDHSSIMIRASFLNLEKQKYRNKNYEDFFFYTDLIRLGKFGFLSERVGSYTYHENQVSKSILPGAAKEKINIRRRALVKCLISKISLRDFYYFGFSKQELLLIFFPNWIYQLALNLRKLS